MKAKQRETIIRMHPNLEQALFALLRLYGFDLTDKLKLIYDGMNWTVVGKPRG